jgi:long-chain acyl-CoA synthetase
VNYSQIESGFLTWLDEGTVADAASGKHPQRLASSGRSLCIARVAIMADDTLAPPGALGEIVVRGASVKNYLDKAHTAQSRIGGWFHTGDIGYFDDDGYLYVCGRMKDIVISGGLKISAAEVEGVILELAEVSECAVIAAPDQVRGEAVVAVVTARTPHSIRSDVIIAHCRRRLGAHKVPRRVEQRLEMPKTAVGKIDKERLRDAYSRTPLQRGMRAAE